MYDREYYQNNRERRIETIVKYQLKELKNGNMKFKTTRRIRSLFSQILKPNGIKQSKTIEQYLGYDIETLKDHLKSTLPEGYN